MAVTLWVVLAVQVVAAGVLLARAVRSPEPRSWRASAAGGVLLVVATLPRAAHLGPGLLGVATVAAVLAVPLLITDQKRLLDQRLRSAFGSGTIDLLAGLAASIAVTWTLLGAPLARETGLATAAALALLVPVAAATLLLAFVVTSAGITASWREARTVACVASAAALLGGFGGAPAAVVLTGDVGLADVALVAGAAGATLLLAVAAWLPGRCPGPVRDEDQKVALIGPLTLTVEDLVVLVWGNVGQVPTAAAVMAGISILFVVTKVAIVLRALTAYQRARRDAETDELTGLGNRRVLRELLERSGEEPTAFLLLDLDRFKEVNDTLGHHHGDDLLRQVADRLRSASAPGEQLVRLGGDEFAVVLPGRGLGAATTRARAVAAALATSFELGDEVVEVGASIGITASPAHGPGGGELLRRADVAMYAAKETHRGAVVYDPSSEAEREAEARLVDELREAVASGQLVVHYQPQVEVGTGRVEGAEALVRWQHPRRGLLLPDAFLPVAQRAGLMPGVTTAVLAHAVAQVAAWRRPAGADGTGRADHLTVSVNISATCLLERALVPTVTHLLAEHGVPASALLLEITENELVPSAEAGRAAVAGLAALGVGVSIDDYGTGYSSLAYLRDLPVRELKLDRTFVADLADDPRAEAIVRTTTDLAHSLGLRLVAEGVEDAATLAALRRLGTDTSQGFWHGEPVPAERFASLHLPAGGPAGAVPAVPHQQAAGTSHRVVTPLA